MMRFMVIAVGTRVPRWAQEATAEYAKRMPRDLPLKLVELRSEPRASGKPAEALLRAEAARIHAALPAGVLRVALDERGRELTTSALARWIAGKSVEGCDIAFIIGGPDGLAPSIKEQAHLRLRLSSLTLPHALVRVVLAEQLYRAVSILRHHPYHRE